MEAFVWTTLTMIVFGIVVACAVESPPQCQMFGLVFSEFCFGRTHQKLWLDWGSTKA